MTEEEKKKQEQQATATQQPDAVEQSIRNMESRAQAYRDYANSPVNIDTSGQTNWMGKIEEVRREYMESPEQKAAREKRERTNRRIAAISDGLVALSNVAGAMAGATPIKPSTSLSEAHRIAVERAAKRRRENAARYEAARKYYAGMQSQQDKLNADRYNAEVKARLDAGKQADTLQGTAARLRQTKANADRDYNFQKEKFEEQKEHNRKTLALQAERNAISRGKGNGGSGKDRYTLTINGKTYTYPSAADYNRAVYSFASDYGVDLREDDGSGLDKYRKTEDIAAELERKAKAGNGKGKGYGNNNGKGRGY